VTICEPQRAVAIDQDGHACFDGYRFTTCRNHSFNSLRADGWKIEPHVLLRLGNFNECPVPSRAQLTRSLDASICPFDRFDRKYGSFLHGNRLPYI
jgi:hypothetical protein